MQKSLLLAISLFIASNTAILHAEGNTAAGKEKSVSCAGCHGDDGNSQSSNFPKLAGQHASYIVKQLRAFKADTRKDPMMAPMATALSDEDMLDIAAFYSNEKVTPNPVDESKADEEKNKLLAKGHDLYRNGDLNEQVSACIACHGPHGNGNKPASYPVLKSQHTDYLIKTLTDFKKGERSPSPDNIMHMIAKKMSDRDIQAISMYLSTLK